MGDQTLKELALMGAGGMLTKIAGDIFLRIFGKELDVYGDWRAYKAQKRVDRWKLGFEESAAMIDTSGKPVQEVSDKILFALFDGMSLEDDEDLRRCWAALLANEATTTGSVRVAFAAMLTEMEPIDVRLLNLVYHATNMAAPPQTSQDGEIRLLFGGDYSFFPSGDSPDAVHSAIANLVRLNVLFEHQPNQIGMQVFDKAIYELTFWGKNFVEACQPPKPATPTPGNKQEANAKAAENAK